MGIVGVTLNLLASILAPIFGWIQSERSYENYQTSLICLCCLGILSLIVAISIINEDLLGEKCLHLPENHPKVLIYRRRLIYEFELEEIQSQDSKMTNNRSTELGSM